MITDSRSFMSYPPHESFRRVLCELLGLDVENGELTDDDALVGTLLRNIWQGNARQHLALPKGCGARIRTGEIDRDVCCLMR